MRNHTIYSKRKGERTLKKMMAIAMLCLSITSVSIGENASNATVIAATSTSLTDSVPVVQIKSRTSKKVVLKIESLKGAAYYKIYRSTSKNGTFTYVGTTSNREYTDTVSVANKSYYYKIKAYNQNKSSKYSKKVKAQATLGKVKGVAASNSTNGIQLTWSELSGAKKYKIYRASSKNGTYKNIDTTTQTFYIDQNVKSSTTYYYKVRGMKTSADTKYYGSYSAIVSGIIQNAQGESASNKELVEEVLRIVNKERAKEGLSALTTNETLTDAAYERAVETKSVFSHTRPDGSQCFTVLDEFGISYMAAGENIAYGQRTPEEVMEAWMNSPGHRANIMGEQFGKVGIGCYSSGGVYYWTQVFTD